MNRYFFFLNKSQTQGPEEKNCYRETFELFEPYDDMLYCFYFILHMTVYYNVKRVTNIYRTIHLQCNIEFHSRIGRYTRVMTYDIIKTSFVHSS